ncbi:MAG: very short patch repair endonuclease [Bosea sp. (in: a-proteobacteria)]
METKTKADRSAIMRAVKSQNTAPERLVRKLLRPIAPGYRLHRNDIPGRPDISYPGRRIAIFVHGCFWHGHNCARGARAPKNNADYWSAKIARTKLRDAANAETLRAANWQTHTIWECELAQSQDAVRRRLAALLNTSGNRAVIPERAATSEPGTFEESSSSAGRDPARPAERPGVHGRRTGRDVQD